MQISFLFAMQLPFLILYLTINREHTKAYCSKIIKSPSKDGCTHVYLSEHQVQASALVLSADWRRSETGRDLLNLICLVWVQDCLSVPPYIEPTRVKVHRAHRLPQRQSVCFVYAAGVRGWILILYNRSSKCLSPISTSILTSNRGVTRLTANLL